jgi:hypothetical protein
MNVMMKGPPEFWLLSDHIAATSTKGIKAKFKPKFKPINSLLLGKALTISSTSNNYSESHRKVMRTYDRADERRAICSLYIIHFFLYVRPHNPPVQ